MTDDMFRLDGQVVIVTGGHGRLGRQFSRAIVERGGRVVVIDRVQDPQVTDSVRMRSICADVTSRVSLEEALRDIESHFGSPTGLVNCAALDSPPGAPPEENGPFETYPETAWDAVLDVNLKGAFLCSQVFGGRMAARGEGSIINISSIYGMVSPDQHLYEYRRRQGETFYKPVAYSASKSGLLNLTRYLATYWAERGVRVNTLTLAGVFDHQHPAFLAEYQKKVPLGRMARADEYDGVVVFLLSRAASYITGSNLVADGGFTAW